MVAEFYKPTQGTDIKRLAHNMISEENKSGVQKP